MRRVLKSSIIIGIVGIIIGIGIAIAHAEVANEQVVDLVNVTVDSVNDATSLNDMVDGAHQVVLPVDTVSVVSVDLL